MLMTFADYQNYVVEATPQFNDRKRAAYRYEAVGHVLDEMRHDPLRTDALVFDGREFVTTREIAEKRLVERVAKRMGATGFGFLPAWLLSPILVSVITAVVQLVVRYLFSTPEAAKFLAAPPPR